MLGDGVPEGHCGNQGIIGHILRTCRRQKDQSAGLQAAAGLRHTLGLRLGTPRFDSTTLRDRARSAWAAASARSALSVPWTMWNCQDGGRTSANCSETFACGRGQLRDKDIGSDGQSSSVSDQQWVAPRFDKHRHAHTSWVLGGDVSSQGHH